MNFVRRTFLSLGLLACSAVAIAQGYPNRPIKIIVPFPPGGATDTLSRLIATKLAETQKWVVTAENKPGAGGNLALDQVAKSAPDGYTILMAQTDNVVLNGLLYSKLSYDPQKDLLPIGLVANGPAVLVVRADSPYKTLAEVVVVAKANPEKLTFASPGAGTIAHLISEVWQKSANVKFTHVPYRGMAQALPDLISGQVDMYMGSIPTLLSQINGGKVRALAVTSTTRSSVLPNVPTYTESGFPKVDLSSVWGLMVSAGTPPEIVSKLNAELNKVLNLLDVKEKIQSSGGGLLSGSPKDMADRYRADFQRLGPVVKDSGAKLD
jgi:tripartite-type tricarboxylate transporter receptor subunit TctC